MLPIFVKEHVKMALSEDLGLGDITTDAIAETPLETQGFIKAKESGVVAGLEIVLEVFQQIDPEIKVIFVVKDGENISKGQILAEIYGNAFNILKGERVALNYLQYLSGIATKTAQIAGLVKHTSVRVVDTRKTLPGMRWLAKYAVRVGGGYNHRFNLSDGVLIKDNHIKAAGGIKAAVEKTRKNSPHTVKIEVEVESIADLKAALEVGADIVMLDNMSLEQVQEAVKLTDKRALLEVSGGITEANIVSYAETGVDIISLGALTHSVKALDLSMDLVSLK